MKEFKDNYGNEKNVSNNKIQLTKTDSNLKEKKLILKKKGSTIKNEVNSFKHFNNNYNTDSLDKKQTFLEKSKSYNYVSYPDYKVIYISNNKISKKLKKAYSKETPCEFKKGLLYIIDQAIKNKKIRAREIFINLNSYDMNLYQDINENLSVKTIILNEILKITQTYSNTFCFDLVLINKPSDLTTFCTKTEKSMNEWIHAILAFKHCNDNVIRMRKNYKTILKFESNKLAKNKNYDLKSLFYDGKDTAFKKNSFTISKDKIIKKHLSNIAHTMEMSSIAHNQLRRRFAGKIKEAKKFANKIVQKQEMIKKMLETQALNQAQKEQNLFILEHKHKELKLLREFENRITKMKVSWY